MTRACRPLTAWRRLAAPLCAAALLVPAPAAADTCSGLAFGRRPPGQREPRPPPSSSLTSTATGRPTW